MTFGPRSPKREDTMGRAGWRRRGGKGTGGEGGNHVGISKGVNGDHKGDRSDRRCLRFSI